MALSEDCQIDILFIITFTLLLLLATGNVPPITVPKASIVRSS